MERLRETVLRPPLGDRFSVPKVGATLTEFQIPSGTSSVGGPSGGTNFGGFGPFMFPTMMMGGQGFPPFMGFGFPWMPAGFGVPGIGLSGLAGNPPVVAGGNGGGGTPDTNPFSSTFQVPWPQNNVFMAEILGWERAVAPPPTGEDHLKWIWKYKWRELGTNNIWGSWARRSYNSNPGQLEGNPIYAYNGCEYANWDGDSEQMGRRTFIGPFARNLEQPHSSYMPFPSSDTDTIQAWQDWSMFTDYVGDTPGGDNSLPLWDIDNGSAVAKIGQPLPIGHHGRTWDESGFQSQGGHTDWSMDVQGKPNVVVLMMERWQKLVDGGLTGGPEWCPDCSANNASNSIQFGDDQFICSYWFYATNSRLDMPWIPSQTNLDFGYRLITQSATQNDSRVPAYGWGDPPAP